MRAAENDKMAGPNCAVMSNFIKIHTHTHTHTRTHLHTNVGNKTTAHESNQPGSTVSAGKSLSPHQPQASRRSTKLALPPG